MSAGREYEQLTKILGEDASTALLEMEKEDTQFRRRAFIRAFFAAVEGELYALKQVLIDMHNLRRVEFSTADLALLREESYDIKPNGRAYAKPKFVSTDTNLRFVVRKVEEAFEIDCNLDTEEQGWKSFKDSIKVRNRITHPKAATEIMVTDAERFEARRAFGWYVANVGELLYATGRFRVKNL